MRVIGLTGFARSGKDTVGRMIAEIEGPHVGRVKTTAYAHLLKLSIARCFLPDPSLEEALEFCERLKPEGSYVTAYQADPEGKGGRDASVTGREFMQNYGTEAHRDTFGEDFWLDAVLPMRRGRGGPARNDCDLLVITDVRFDNEAQRVRAYGGEVWRIERDTVATGDGHSSEQELPGELIDLVIDNNGTLGSLRGAVRTALHR